MKRITQIALAKEYCHYDDGEKYELIMNNNEAKIISRIEKKRLEWASKIIPNIYKSIKFLPVGQSSISKKESFSIGNVIVTKKDPKDEYDDISKSWELNKNHDKNKSFPSLNLLMFVSEGKNESEAKKE